MVTAAYKEEQLLELKVVLPKVVRRPEAALASLTPHWLNNFIQENVASFLRPVFPASRLQHISDLHSKFALRPHHV